MTAFPRTGALYVEPMFSPFLLWKRTPAGWREAVHRSAQRLLRDFTPVWLRWFWRRDAVRPELSGSVTVQGLFRSSIGIAQGARLFAHALEATGIPVERIDAGEWAKVSPVLPPAPPGPGGPSRRLAVSHLNPLELEKVIGVSWGRALRGRRHVGYWAWELPVAPLTWRRAFRFVDEVWAPSAFTADALRLIGPSDVPVYVVPHPVWATPAGGPDRKGFGLRDDACIVLVALDLRSTGARKNPVGALQAYATATEMTAKRVTLACKISGGDADPALFAQVKAWCDARVDVVWLEGVLSERRMASLVASADIVLSPHRAEGFGLLLAEAMRLGKAVVATGWSGNMEFMDGECAALIDFTLAPVRDPKGLYGQSEWAEPDLDHASRLLADLIESPARRAALGARAMARGGPTFDRQAWGRLIDERMAPDSQFQRLMPSRLPA